MAPVQPERVYSVSVAGVVVDGGGRVLVVQRRDNGRWEAPGGVLEAHEPVEQGVRREVREETGVHVEVERLTGVYQNLTRNVIALVYRCHPVGGLSHELPYETDEASGLRWADRAEIDGLMVPAYAIRVHDAFAVTPVSRVHDGENLL